MFFGVLLRIFGDKKVFVNFFIVIFKVDVNNVELFISCCKKIKFVVYVGFL